MQKQIIHASLCIVFVAVLLQACATVTSGPLSGGRHTIEVTGFLSSATTLYQKFEEKAAEICGGPFVIESQDYERDEGGDDTTLVGIVQCQ
ncbi:MAG: hypothetical protein GY801_05325 [bacterium]|nr:hypothetical protein [bacterium]